ncbi:MAG: radical SAM peptide maturase, partial [bacterium]
MNSQFIKIDANIINQNLINLKQLVFEVTDACNLKCKYCGYGELYEGYDPRRRQNLSLKRAKNVILYLAEIWNKNIDSSLCQPFSIGFYGGEPLINIILIKDMIRFTESLEINRKKIYYNMTTNGILLKRHIDFLVNKKIRLLISLDGNEQNHSYRIDHHGNNSHKQIVNNVKKLQLKYPEYFKKYVRFNTVLHNMNSVESAHKYVMDTFGKKTTISSLNNSGIRQDKVKEFYNMFQNVDASIEKSGNREKLETELFLEAPRISQLTNFIYT